MKTYKITKGNKQYVIKAKDTYSAVVRLHTILKDQKQVAKFTKFNNGDVAEGFIMETNKGFTFTSPQNPKDDKDFSTQKLAEIHANKLGYVKDSKPIEDDRLSPMTYQKLKELGYNHSTWKNLTQEEANKIVSEGKQSESTKSTKQEQVEKRKPTVSKEILVKQHRTKVLIDRYNKLQNSKQTQEVLKRIKNKQYLSKEELEDLPYQKQIDFLIKEYDKVNGNTIDDNSPQRKKLRQKVTKILSDRGSYSGEVNGKDTYNGPIKKERKAVVVIGLPASGKSSRIVNKVSPELGAYVMDSDEAKFLLPEFKASNGLAANSIHKESQQIIKDVFESKLKDGTNMVIPVIGSNEDTLNEKWLKYLNDAGYDIEIKYQPADSTESMNRVIGRSISKNRPISSNIVFGYGDKPESVYNALKGKTGKNGKPYIRE